jgi:hypothetical protein
MKSINQYISEKLFVKSNHKEYKYHPKYAYELTELMEKLIKERGNEGDFNDIDVSKLTNMDYIFKDKFPLFNGDISEWDVSNVTRMRKMFEECHRFEGKGLNNWDVSNCENFELTFKGCGSLETDNIEEWGKKIKPSAYIKHMFAHNNFTPSWYKE